jgi:hypothetical protein
LLDRGNRLIGGRQDDVDLHAHELGRGLRETLTFEVAGAELEDDFLPLDVATLPHALLEGLDEGGGAARRRARVEDPDLGDFRARLRPRGERRHQDAEDQRDGEPQEHRD